MTPLKAIRAKCLDCNYNAREVRLCPCKGCPLYKYRLGKNPNREGTMSDAQKKLASDRMKEYHSKRKADEE